VVIRFCPNVRGEFIDLADFPRLKELELTGPNNVTGGLALDGCNVLGGICHRFENVSDVPSFMHTIHLLLHHTPTMFSPTFVWRDGALCWN
jgi:hypothetical protein